MLPFLLQASDGKDAPQWIAIAIGVLGLAYIVMRPKFGKRGKDPLENAPQRISLAQQRSLERDMSSLVVELSEMARQITAQLDTRAAKLEALIAEADERIAQLKRLSSAAPLHGQESLRHDLPAASQTPPVEEPLDPRHAAVYALADEGLGPHEIAQRLDRPKGEIELILALRPAQSSR